MNKSLLLIMNIFGNKLLVVPFENVLFKKIVINFLNYYVNVAKNNENKVGFFVIYNRDYELKKFSVNNFLANIVNNGKTGSESLKFYIETIILNHSKDISRDIILDK